MPENIRHFEIMLENGIRTSVFANGFNISEGGVLEFHNINGKTVAAFRDWSFFEDVVLSDYTKENFING